MKMNVSVIQMTSVVGDKEASISKALNMIDQAMQRDKNTKVIILPEFFNTEYFAQYWDYKYLDYAEPIPGYTINRLIEGARKHNIYIIATIYEKASAGVYYDTASVINPEGNIIAKYRKTHAAAIGGLEKVYFRGGSSFPIFEIENFKCGIAICYDISFPEVSRIYAVKGAEVIFFPFAARERLRKPPIEIWDCRARVRAYENAIYLVICNKIGREGNWVFGGGSMVVAPSGRIIAKAPDEETIISATLDLEEIDRARKLYPVFRDRRPEIYKPLCELIE